MIIFIILLALSIISIPLVYYLFDKVGLKILFLTYYLLSFIFLFKNVNILNINFGLMIVPYVSLLSIVYIFIEKISTKDMQKTLHMVIVFLILVLVSIFLLILYNQSVTDVVTVNLKRMVENNILLLIFFPIIVSMSIYSTYKIYNLMKKNSNILFVNISLTTILVGILDCIIFNIIGNLSTLDFMSLLKLGLGNYLLKIILSIIFIPVISYTTKRKRSLQ